MHRVDRMKEFMGKSRAGGVCFFINNSWCDERNIHSVRSFCSPDLEYLTLLCRPFWLPREFTVVIITAVYILPQANTEQALKELYGSISEQKTALPEAVFITTGDFKHANFRKIAPKYFQHITINTCGDRVLDHCYFPFRDAYKSLPAQRLANQTNHPFCSCLLTGRNLNGKHPPSGRFKAGQTNQILHCKTAFNTLTGRYSGLLLMTISRFTRTQSQVSSGSVLKMCCRQKIVCFYPNQKPWINSNVRAALSARTSAFKSGNTEEQKQANYEIWKTIKAAKRQYKNKIEGQFNINNVRSMWQSTNNITDFKRGKAAAVTIAASLLDELNEFYSRFEAHNTVDTEIAPTADAEAVSTFSISAADVTRSFRRVNIRKAAGPKACTHQLAGVFTDIFNLSLSLSVVPSCFKTATIVLIPKTAKTTCLNDWCPVALTPILSKCFEKLIKTHICSVLPASLDPLQFTYRSNRSTDDAIAFTLHTALSHLDSKNTHVRMLFLDYSSAFNTIVPTRLVMKLQTLGLNESLSSWILDFLSGRRQVVRMGNITSSALVLNTGAPQGCVLSPLLYSLYTHDCTATHSSNVIVKFADDMTVVDLITDNDETAYREEVHALTRWC